MKEVWDFWGRKTKQQKKALVFQHLHICIKGVPERGDRETGIKNMFEIIMAEKFPKLKKETDMQVQDT